MTSDLRKEILWIYTDGRTLMTDCHHEVNPAPILQQMEIDPLESYVIMTHFNRTTPEGEEPIIYEEFKSECKRIVEGNVEAIRRIKALRGGPDV